MNNIILKSIPNITFAQSYSAKATKYIQPIVKNCIEVTYIQQGTYILEKNNELYTLNTGDILCNTFDQHINVQIKDFCEINTFIIYFDAINSEVPSSESFSLPFHITAINASEISKKISKLIVDILVEYNTNNKKSLHIISLIFEVLHILNKYLLNPLSEKNNITHSDIAYADKIKKYVFDHLKEKIELLEIASYLDLTVPYICNIFRKVTNKTIIQYVNIKKLEKVKDLIISSNLTMQQAGEQVGLHDVSYISRMFKKYFHANISSIKKVRFF